jgi:hypothetical protein
MRWPEIAEEWPGETVFIVAGGPSVRKQNLELLRGRRVIAINSSWESVPWADVLFFGDSRWWFDHWKVCLRVFKGRVITCAPGVAKNPRVTCLRKASPPGYRPSAEPVAGLSEDRHFVTMKRTSLTGAVNVAAHLGSRRQVWLGVDGGVDKKGRTHHHKPHRWPQKPGCWEEQRKDIAAMVEPLKARGIEVINASPGSVYDYWPVMPLEDALAHCALRDSE